MFHNSGQCYDGPFSSSIKSVGFLLSLCDELAALGSEVLTSEILVTVDGLLMVLLGLVEAVTEVEGDVLLPENSTLFSVSRISSGL